MFENKTVANIIEHKQKLEEFAVKLLEKDSAVVADGSVYVPPDVFIVINFYASGGNEKAYPLRETGQLGKNGAIRYFEDYLLCVTIGIALSHLNRTLEAYEGKTTKERGVLRSAPKRMLNV